MTTGNPARRRANPVRARGLTLAWGGVDSRPIRRWRGLFAALLIVLGAAAAAPEQAAAQTVTTFISNTGQSGNSSSNSNLAQAFITGAGTYTLSSVALFLHFLTAGTTPQVQIYGNTGGSPGTLVATMTNPAPLVNGAINLFTAPANTTLSASTDLLASHEQFRRDQWCGVSGRRDQHRQPGHRHGSGMEPQLHAFQERPRLLLEFLLSPPPLPDPGDSTDDHPHQQRPGIRCHLADAQHRGEHSGGRQCRRGHPRCDGYRQRRYPDLLHGRHERGRV